MAAIGKVSLRGITQDDFQYTFLLATGSHEAIDSDATVKAVTNDTSAANQAKLAVDGSRILGRLEVYELRTAEGITVGTIALQGGIKFMVTPNPVLSPDQRPAVGDFIVGAVASSGERGFVRKATTAELALGTCANFLVVEASSDHSYVIAISV